MIFTGFSASANRVSHLSLFTRIRDCPTHAIECGSRVCGTGCSPSTLLSSSNCRICTIYIYMNSYVFAPRIRFNTPEIYYVSICRASENYSRLFENKFQTENAYKIEMFRRKRTVLLQRRFDRSQRGVEVC